MKTIFFTFDMDWAIDEVLDDFYQLIKQVDIVGTIHITHQTRFIDLFRKEKYLEIGVHPNYNTLLFDKGGGSIETVLSEIKEIVPEAICCRSHALTASSVIDGYYKKYGIKYDLNYYIPAMEGLRIYPFKSSIGDFVRIPFIYEDDLYLNEGKPHCFKFYLGDSFDAVRVFNFHPIHLYLNTDSIDTYEKARPYFKNHTMLKKCKNQKNYGIRDFFLDLVTFAKQEGYISKKIAEGEWNE